MQNRGLEREYETRHLEAVISIAHDQLKGAKLHNEDADRSILSLKQELRESTSHSISGLWNAQNFEDLIALSQLAGPILDQVADYEATSNKIAKLEKIVNSPYFARIDFKFHNEGAFQKIYIGRSSLMKENPFEIVVYDWRSPVASVFYRFGMGPAFYEAPHGRIDGEVNLKRQYEIHQGILEYFFDADVQIIDEFLRKLLSQNSSSKMKAIVETIQKEQDIVIRDMENDLMMVQGVAGSGKTSIALQRAAYLMYQGLSNKLAANNIIIISPNPVFEQYISNVLPELGEEHVVSVVFEEILVKILRNEQIQTRNQFLERLITKSQDRELLKSCIKFKTSLLFSEILHRFIDDLPHHWIHFTDVCSAGVCVLSKETIRERIVSGRKETPLGLKLKLLEEFILETVHASRKGRARKSEHAAIKKEIQKFTELNVRSLYRKLWSDKEYFDRLAKDIVLPDCMEDIRAYTQDNLRSNLLSYDDAVALACLRLKISGGTEYQGIKQVVIDEAQDYYPLHYEILNLLFPKAKYTILGDINQTLERQGDFSLYEQINGILHKNKSILVTMDKSFRCTNEILMYSSKLINGKEKVRSFNRKGEEPQIHIAPDEDSLTEMMLAEIQACLEKGYQSIGLICKSEKNALALFDCLKERMDIQRITNDSQIDLRGILVLPVYLSKGLEFDAVLLCDADEANYHNEDDRRLLYIACTRALHRLSLFCKGAKSSLL